MSIVLAQSRRTGTHQPLQFCLRITDAFCPLHDCFHRTPFQRNAAALFFFYVSFVIKLHSCCNSTWNRNRIQSVFITPHICFIDCIQIIISAVSSVCPQWLILRTACHSSVYIYDTATGDRTAVTCTVFHQIFLFQCLTGNVIALWIVSFLPVLCRECTNVVDNIYQYGCTKVFQTCTGNRICL